MKLEIGVYEVFSIILCTFYMPKLFTAVAAAATITAAKQIVGKMANFCKLTFYANNRKIGFYFQF
jgi:hypothetical protein